MYHQLQQFAGHDRLTLAAQSWGPDAPARAAVVLIHGLIEHSGRHAKTAEELVRRGFAVHAMDLRGHGRSGGRRGDVRSFDQYLLDLDVFFARVRAAEEDRPIYLIGNSMGGLIVSLWTSLRQPKIAGLILTGALFEMADQLYPRLRHLAAAANRVIPWVRVPSIPFDWLSRDPNAIAAFRNDPLVCQRGFTVRVAAEARRAMKEMSARAAELRDPLLILHGGDDRICGPEGARSLYAKAGSADKAIHVYDGLYHEIFDEPEREKVLADLTGWLNRHAPQCAGTTCHAQLVR
jgi:alpha-beta hydrolase superfamily lysophospholipase